MQQKKKRRMKRRIRLWKNPLGGVGGPQPSDFSSEPSDMCGGLGCLAQQGFPYAVCLLARRAAGE